MKNILLAIVVAIAGYYIWDAGIIQEFVGPERTHDRIIVYSAADCRICDKVVEAIEQEGFAVTVFYIDQDPGGYEQLRETLEGMHRERQIFDLPVVDIFGRVLTDSPSPRKVREHLPQH